LGQGLQAGLSDIEFQGSQGWAVGTQGVILYTNDSGKRWEPQQSGTIIELKDVEFTDTCNGLIVGNCGTILKTRNSGREWIKIKTNFDIHLNGISAIDTNYIFIVGNQGTLISSEDGCQTWDTRNFGNSDLLAIQFIDTKHGWIVGGGWDNSIILYTSDGGFSWQEQINPMNQGLRDVCFIDSKHGWAVGGDWPHVPAVLKTNDGGRNWLLHPTPSHLPLFSVYLIDRNHGWAVGQMGTILKTADGGVTWISDRLDTHEYLHDVWFKDIRTGWVVGSGGLILHWTGEDTTMNKTADNADYVKAFPNPFHSRVNVIFLLLKDGVARVSVYNVMGQLVEQLADGFMEKGAYMLTFEPKSLKSGVYFIFVETREYKKVVKTTYLSN